MLKELTQIYTQESQEKSNFLHKRGEIAMNSSGFTLVYTVILDVLLISWSHIKMMKGKCKESFRIGQLKQNRLNSIFLT